MGEIARWVSRGNSIAAELDDHFLRPGGGDLAVLRGYPLPALDGCAPRAGQRYSAAVYALGFCFAICWLIWTFTNETILTLDAAELKLQRRAMGIELFTESYPTMSVRNVNYVPPTRSWASQDDTDPKTSKIQFQAGFLTRTFASGVTEAEAKALIAGMQDIYRFPNYLESHSAHPAL